MALRLRFAWQEERVTKRTFGILAGVVGSAVGAWLLNRQRVAMQDAQRLAAKRDHGTVIFHNTPKPVEGNVI